LEDRTVRYHKQAMIVAPQPEAAEAGADALREGGNAVDAGIACALVQGVVDPLMCGIAGFGSCGMYMPQEPTPALPHRCGSTTVCTSAQAMPASTALPPSRRMSAPASVGSGCGATIIAILA
jgi:gamma-glutamyltranspeptidase